MYLSGFSCKEDIELQFEAPEGILGDAHVYFAKYQTEHYEGRAFVLYELNGKLYEVHGSHCSCHGLEGQWQPEETTIEVLYYRWFQEDRYPSICDNEEDLIALKRIVLGEIFEKNVLIN